MLFNIPYKCFSRTFDGRTLPADDSDICEPLSTLTVCNNLNDSAALCQPSTWAGDAIQDAINATRLAMAGLRQALHFSVTSEPYQAARANASAVVFRIRQNVQEEFAEKMGGFLSITEVLMKLAPLSVLLLVYAGYRHVRLYVSVDAYNNLYVNERFRALDQQRCLACNGDTGLMPLKRYELKYLADTSDWRLSDVEKRMCWSGLCVFFLQLLLTSLCFSFDVILYWVLSLVGKYGSFGFEVTEAMSDSELGMMVTGEGLLVDLLDVFLGAFHPTQWPGYASVAHSCLPEPRAPSAVTIATMLLLHLTLLLSIVWKARVFRIRDEVTGYFYPERAEQRTIQLYRVVLAQRLALKSRLHKIARANYDSAQTKRNCSAASRFLARLKTCRRVFATANRCVVCGSRSGGAENFFVCPTQHCRAVYCKECIADVGHVCAICAQRDESQQDDASNCDCIDDSLLMYSLVCRRHNDF